MFNLFNKKTETATAPTQTVHEVIAEIHDTFYTEVDRLLAQALVVNSLETDKQEVVEKGKRLFMLGFDKSHDTQLAKEEMERLEALQKDNERKKDLVDTINYFSHKYPNYKFITEESVKTICDKYGLVYGDVANYTGTVPDKNLQHIIDFTVLEEDECYEVIVSYMSAFDGRKMVMSHQYLTKANLDRRNGDKDLAYAALRYRTTAGKCPLEIAAPVKDFDMTNMEVKDGKVIQKVEIPDPIVLKPVVFGGKKHYLIVTAWGLEASDELVVNQKMN